ncbi:MAG: signal peptidase I [Actinomycetota bacterium]|nr:signal peptidase I [Actinomycetota bacterium]
MATLRQPSDDRHPSVSPVTSPKEQRGSFWRELPVLVVVALAVAVLIKTFLVQAFYIPSGSMEPTLHPGDRVLVNKLAYRLGEPERGDIVVFDSPFRPHQPQESFLESTARNVAEALGIGSPASEFIKRIVALPGDSVEIREGRVYVNGQLTAEPYLGNDSMMGNYGPVEVPPDEVFVMGDNRSHSQDSRVFGTISFEEVVGEAFVRVWPPTRWDRL